MLMVHISKIIVTHNFKLCVIRGIHDGEWARMCYMYICM